MNHRIIHRHPKDLKNKSFDLIKVFRVSIRKRIHITVNPFLRPFSIGLLFCFLLFSNSLIAVDAKYIDLSCSELKVHSQNGEDGVIRKIFELIGETNQYYVEFGTENAEECNTHDLRNRGWRGLLMDGQWERPEINLHREFVYAENINTLFEKYRVPAEFDLLSIDIDSNDFYVWQLLSILYRPRVVVIEYNATHLPHEDKVILYDRLRSWDGTNYFGASLLALYNLGRVKGYSLVYSDNNGVNLFFIRDDIVQSLEKMGCYFIHKNDVNALYKRPRYGRGPNGGHIQDLQMRAYISSKDILNPS